MFARKIITKQVMEIYYESQNPYLCMTYNVVTSHIFSEKYLEVGIFIIIFEIKLVGIAEAKVEEMNITSILQTSLPFPLIIFIYRFQSPSKTIRFRFSCYFFDPPLGFFSLVLLNHPLIFSFSYLIHFHCLNYFFS